MAAPVTVRDVLRLARPEAFRNAAVLDHFSAPPPPHLHTQTHSSLPTHTPPPDHPHDPRPAQQPPHTAARKSNTQNPQDRGEPASPPPSAPPISRYLLSSLFAAVDRLSSRPKLDKSPNYVFVDSHQEDHFLYGLVLPVIARLLAVSYPGILCVVQLQRQDPLPDSSPPLDGASNGSKSLSHTTPSAHETSRTPSPSDEEVGTANRKSISPDANPKTAELIRHADKILSGAEAAAEKTADEIRISEESSPPPESQSLQDHATLRLICNGFEVLTGKMPRPRYNMGSFTMGSVGWEKAGVVSPEHAAKGVTMNFSNGMMMSTEGIVVTFSNGSMCFLTTRDALSTVESLNISDATPVVAFSFSCPGQLSMGSLLQSDFRPLTLEAERVRTTCERSNVLFVEIGHNGGCSENDMQRVCDNALQGNGQCAESWDISTQEEAPKAAKSEDQSANDPNAFPRCPAVVIAAVPRAVPLFVNTINQTFVDGPYFEFRENTYENEFINERYRDMRREAGLRRANRERHQNREKEKLPSTSGRVLHSTPDANACQNTISKKALPDASHDSGGPPTADGRPEGQNLSHAMAGRAAIGTAPLHTAATSSAYHAQASRAIPVPPHRPVNQNERPSSVYSYYSYGPGHVYPDSSAQGNTIHPSRPIVGAPVGLHQGQAQINGSHAGYYHAVRATAAGANGHGHYHHHPGSSYPTQPYYALPPASVVHQGHQNSGQLHPGLPSMSHRPGPLPPPHPMDARTDMPVQFSSHHAIASAHGQYSAQYYSCPSHAGQRYDSRQNDVTTGMGMHSEPRQPVAEPGRGNDPGNFAWKERNPISKTDVVLDEKGASSPKPSGPATNTPEASPNGRKVGKVGPEGEDQNHPSGNEPLTADKENALRALIQMRAGVHGDGGKRQEKRRRRTVGAIELPRGGPEHSTRGRSNESLMTSSEACNIEEDMGAAARVKSPVNGTFVNRARLSTGTNSSTSTNSHSQGRPLIPGVLVGNSHNPNRQRIAGSQPQKKRSRQR